MFGKGVAMNIGKLIGVLQNAVKRCVQQVHLARSFRDLQNLVHDLEAKGVTIMALDQAIDTRTPHGKAFLGMLAVFAEFETNIRKERQLEGIAKAKAEGAYTGRKPTAQAKRAEVETLLSQGMSKPKIAEALGMSVASVYNVLKIDLGKEAG